MKNEEILKKAIDKAISNGWDVFGFHGYYNTHKEFRFEVTDFFNGKHPMTIRFSGTDGMGSNPYEPNTIIFSHDFAKAFWGDGEIVTNQDSLEEEYQIEVGTFRGLTNYTFSKYPAWQYHLQRMVISENPIKYLEQFMSPIEGEKE